MKKYYILAALLAAIAGGTYLTVSTSNVSPEETSNGAVNETNNETGHLTICSFNVQFLGHFKKKDDEALAAILKDYDIVVIQELVAPPIAGVYPDNETYTADADSTEFFDAMEDLNFSYKLSDEDTGTNDEIHKNSSATEWWVTFYKPEAVTCVNDIPSGFLADDRSNHDDYERVPYAFAFRTPDDMLDFVLISVHLQPGDSGSDKARRKHELGAIAN